MLLIPNHFYYVRVLTSHDNTHTVAEYDGDRWWVIGYDCFMDREEIEPICEMVREDGKPLVL